ncbi:hypothetical protein BHE74_00002693, partial [Ensete ventricosum]
NPYLASSHLTVQFLFLFLSGCGYLKDQRNDFGVEYGSDCSSSFRKEESSSGQGSYNTSVKPRERPMDKEQPREAEIRWSSPSVIAKLMGLDEQPPVQVVHKRKKTINGYFQDIPSTGLQEKYLTREECLPRMSMAEHQELNDVYEVIGRPKVERDRTKTDSSPSFRIPIAGKASRFLKVQNDSFSHKIARFAGNNYQCIHPNHIVLLKHNIDKARRSVHLRTPENLKFSHRRPSAQTGFRGAHGGRRDRLNFSHNSEAFHCKNKGSRELDREITELRESVRSSKMSVPVVEYDRFSREDSSCNISDMKSFCSPEGSSNHFNNSNSLCFALAPSTEFIRSEARKRVSGNWKMTGNSKETVDCDKGSSALAEMLALSDVEGQNSVSSSSKVRNVSVEKSTRPDMQASGGSPLSISNSDSWEDGFFTNLPNPASNLNHFQLQLEAQDGSLYDAFLFFQETSFDHLQVDREWLTSVRITEALQPCAVSEHQLPLRVNGSGCSESLTGDLGKCKKS